MFRSYNTSPSSKSGFTLIEISTVLVVIGLITGVIIAGRELFEAASVHAQLSQIEKYNTALHIFETKYDFLPGDIPDPSASNYGFQARGPYDGQGDGNGVIEGNCYNSVGMRNGFNQGCGELAVFWVDLSTANLLDSSITYKGVGYPSPTANSTTTSTTTPNLNAWLPAAKLGNGNFVYVF